MLKFTQILIQFQKDIKESRKARTSYFKKKLYVPTEYSGDLL
jgi:hypothetical protein